MDTQPTAETPKAPNEVLEFFRSVDFQKILGAVGSGIADKVIARANEGYPVAQAEHDMAMSAGTIKGMSGARLDGPHAYSGADNPSAPIEPNIMRRLDRTADELWTAGNRMMNLLSNLDPSYRERAEKEASMVDRSYEQYPHGSLNYLALRAESNSVRLDVILSILVNATF